MEFRFVDHLAGGAVHINNSKVLVPLGANGKDGVGVIWLTDYAAAMEAGAFSFNRGPNKTVIPNIKEKKHND